MTKRSWSIAFGLAVATLCTPLTAGQGQSAQVMLESARKAETIDGNPKAAIALYEQIVKRFPTDRTVVADALVRMAGAYRKLGNAQAKAIYERVLREYGDQAAAATIARAALREGAPAGRDASLSKRRLWSGPEVDTTGRVTPDGRYLTFTDWETGDLAIRDLEQGTNRRLTNKGSWVQSSAYAELSVVSPDGQSVAYGWYDGKDEYVVQVLAIQGNTPPRRLLGGGEGNWVAPLDWSGDAQRLVISVGLRGGRGHLSIVDASSGAVLRTIEADDAVSARFSPDGRRLAFGRSRATPNGTARDIFVAELATGREHRVLEGTGHSTPMAWTTDGLLYASTSGASTVLWLQRMQSGMADGSRMLVTNDAGVESLGVTRDGGLVVGAGGRGGDLFLAEVDLATGELVGEPTRPLDGFMSAAMQPTWSPDGASLAYVSPRSRSGRNAVLGIRDSATGRVRELQPALARFFFPRWSPDGKAVLVQGLTLDTKQGLFSIDAGTGDVTTVLLASEGEQLAMPQPSPDGKHLYFGRVGKSGRKLIARDLATGAERESSVPPGSIGMQLSPDGRWLAMVVRDALKDRGSIVVMPSSGGEVREVFAEAPASSLTNWVSWSSDSRHVFALKATGGPTPSRETVMLSLDGGVPRTIRLPARVAGSVVMHPDGKRVAFTTMESRNEVWVLENFVPRSQSAGK